MSGAVEGVVLLPCPNPWCHSHERDFPLHQLGIIEWPIVHGRIGFRVRCNDCGLTGPVTDKKAEVYSAWNTRTTPPARSYADGVEDAAKVAEVERDKSAVAVEDLKGDEGAQSVAAGGYLSSKRIAAAIRLLSQGGKA